MDFFDSSTWRSIDVLTVDGKRIGSNQKGLIFKDAFTDISSGINNTAEVQANLFVEILRRESGRSAIFRLLLDAIVNDREDTPVKIYFGQNSTNFVDSAENWSFDINDLLSFPVDPIVSENGHYMGLTQGELLVHILEERYYMRAPGQGYKESHSHCLSPGSFQNRYRRDLGYNSDTIWFELVDAVKEGQTDVMADFWSLAGDGAVSRIKDLPVSKALEPLEYANYDAKNNKATHELVDFIPFVDQIINENLHKIQKDIVTNKKFPESPPVDMTKHLIMFRYPSNSEEMTMKLLDTLLIGNTRLKTWSVLNMKLKFCNTAASFEKLFTKEELGKLARQTMLDFAKKNDVNLVKGWRNKIDICQDIEQEIENVKLALVANIKEKTNKFKLEKNVEFDIYKEIEECFDILFV